MRAVEAAGGGFEFRQRAAPFGSFVATLEGSEEFLFPLRSGIGMLSRFQQTGPADAEAEFGRRKVFS